MPRGIPANKTTAQATSHHAKTQTNLEAIRVGKLNGGYVVLVQKQWEFLEECLERAGYKLTFTTERLMHGANEGDIMPKARTAGAGS